jgi:uncharacterized membrane protein YbjE (DUF340 family)
MVAATSAVSVVLAVILTATAIWKLSHREQVVQSYVRIGVPEDKLNYLALVLLAGAAGLLLGLQWAPIGVAAAIGLIVYFLVAAGIHVRANDVRNLPTPLAILTLAGATLALRLATFG